MATVFLEKTEGATNSNGLLEECDPCRRCPLYKGTKDCCVTGQSFDDHPNLQRLVGQVQAAVSETPQTLAEIVIKIVQQTGNRMNFRKKKIIGAAMCVLHRLPEVRINKDVPSKPVYYRDED